MTKCRSRRAVLRVVCLGLMASLTYGLQTTSFAQLHSAQGELSPRMATYDNAEGETCFSLSLGNVDADVQRPSDIIVFVDTSASQTGSYKQDSIAVLQSFLSSLNASDRVKVFAVDLDPVALNQEFTSPDSSEVQSSIDNLRQRVALGSTDMIKMLKTAADGFQMADDRNRNVIYIGDGVSRAGLVTDKSLSKTTRKLVKNEIPFSSFAIGPDRNIELLAAIANHSGGNVIADVDQPSSLDNAARNLAASVHESVFWPSSAELPENIASIYPQVCPPIRSDRDSVVFGKVTARSPITLKLSGKLNGQNKSIVREITPEDSNIDFAFLPSLIEVASKNAGIRLPTVGSEGVRQYARVLDHTADSMANLGVRALAMNDAKAATTFANAALERNPAGIRAQQVAMAARFRAQDNPFGDAPETEASSPFGDTVEAPEPDASSPFGNTVEAPEPTVDDPFGSIAETETPISDGSMTKEPMSDGSMTKEPASEGSSTREPMAEGSMTKDSMADGSMTKEPTETDGDIFGSVEEADRALQFNSVPAVVNDDIGAPLQMGMPVEIRESDIDRILADAKRGGKRIIDKEVDRQKIVEQKIRKQVQYEITRAVGELRSSPVEAINRLKNMIEVVDQTSELNESALTDLRYSLESALNSARQQKLSFESQEAESAKNKAIATSILRTADAYQREEEKFARLINQFNSLMKERNYVSAAGVVETAYELAPNSPETVVAQVTARARIGYERALRTQRMKELSNLQMLHDTDRSSISFLDDRLITFPDAEVWLERKNARKKFQNARLTGSALDEAILDALEKPTNLEYNEVPFIDVKRDLEDKFGINIKLDQSAIDDALTDEELITVRSRGIRLKNALRLMLKDYNATYIVRDEVLQIISLSNVSDPENLVTDVYNVGDLVAPRFNPFAGLGGQQGGGGIGGGGGGGIGGGGGGRGGGGGAFCIQDGAVSTTSKVEAKNVSSAVKKPAVIELNSDAAPAEAWTDYFSRVHPSPENVRETVRSYVEAKRFDDIVGLIYGAMQNDRVEPWMFEALGYAMKLSGKPTSEIERVFMSAMDFATSPTAALNVAKYMMKSGMEKRGLEILHDIATLVPTSTQPYLLGLDVAKKTENKEALQWLTVGILSQEWPENQLLSRRAQNISTALLADLKASDSETAKEYAQAISEAKQRDCVVEISYTGDADLDLYMQEPGGTICSRLITRTTAGGVHFGDNASKGSNQSGKITEKYVLPKGFSGDYQLVIKRITGKVTSGKVNVDVRHHVNSDSETREARPVTIEGKGTVVNFTLADGRREDSLEAHTLKTLVDKQMIVGSRVLAQQLAQGSSSTAASEYYGGLVGGGEDGSILDPGNSNLFRGGAVGYQPEIETFDISTNLQVQHATTSDRLYVIVSLTPNFTDLTDVENFNALGDVDTAGGAGAP